MNRNGLFALVFHTLFVVFMIAPLVVVIWISFTPSDLLRLPFTDFSLRWFYAILDDRQFVDALWRSVVLGGCAATIAVMLALPSALALYRYNFLGKSALVSLFLSPLLIPHVVLGVAFLRFFSEMRITGSVLALATAHVIIIYPYALRLILSSLTGLDQSLERAAKSLGASNFTIFRRVTVPAITAGIVGGWAISFIQSFDEVTMTVFISTPSSITLPVRMYHYIEESIDPLVASVSTVVIFGTFLIMFLIDKVYGLDEMLVGSGRGTENE